jgi:hypothetical protein
LKERWLSKPIYKELIMAIVVLKLPNVKRKQEIRLRRETTRVGSCRFGDRRTDHGWIYQ